MRPVDKGASPQAFQEYTAALPFLETRIGRYCSYCERYIADSIAVEHIQPKSRKRSLALKWENFLLACKNCNSIKGKKAVRLDACYWPDQDNTALAFEYLPDGIIRPNSKLNFVQIGIAQKSLELVGLDRKPGHRKFSSKDMRWEQRGTTLEVAKRSKARLMANDTIAFREQIIETAIARGFWSIWVTVFADDDDMRKRLVNAFPGTCLSCFNNHFQPTPRPGGKI